MWNLWLQKRLGYVYFPPHLFCSCSIQDPRWNGRKSESGIRKKHPDPKHCIYLYNIIFHRRGKFTKKWYERCNLPGTPKIVNTDDRWTFVLPHRIWLSWHLLGIHVRPGEAGCRWAGGGRSPWSQQSPGGGAGSAGPPSRHLKQGGKNILRFGLETALCDGAAG